MQDIFSYLSPYKLVGITGAFSYFLSYVLAAFDRLPSQSPNYYTLKLFSASCVAFSLLEDFNIASAIIQIAFIVLSVIGIARHLYAKAPIQLFDMTSERDNVGADMRVRMSEETSA